MDDLKPGDICIMEHAFVSDCHVIAKIEAVTAKTVEVRHYRPDRGFGLSTERTFLNKRRRKISAVVAVMPIDCDVEVAAQKLIGLHDGLAEKVKSAQLEYYTGIELLTRPTPNDGEK